MRKTAWFGETCNELGPKGLRCGAAKHTGGMHCALTGDPECPVLFWPAGVFKKEDDRGVKNKGMKHIEQELARLAAEVKRLKGGGT